MPAFVHLCLFTVDVPCSLCGPETSQSECKWWLSAVWEAVLLPTDSFNGRLSQRVLFSKDIVPENCLCKAMMPMMHHHERYFGA